MPHARITIKSVRPNELAANLRMRLNSYTKYFWKTKLKKLLSSTNAVLDEMRPIRIIEILGMQRRWQHLLESNLTYAKPLALKCLMSVVSSTNQREQRLANMAGLARSRWSARRARVLIIHINHNLRYSTLQGNLRVTSFGRNPISNYLPRPWSRTSCYGRT